MLPWRGDGMSPCCVSHDDMRSTIRPCQPSVSSLLWRVSQRVNERLVPFRDRPCRRARLWFWDTKRSRSLSISLCRGAPHDLVLLHMLSRAANAYASYHGRLFTIPNFFGSEFSGETKKLRRIAPSNESLMSLSLLLCFQPNGPIPNRIQRERKHTTRADRYTYMCLV